MKTPVQIIIDYLQEMLDDDFDSRTKYIQEFCEQTLIIEKQQHEQTAISITNVFMDALDNPKGGKFNTVDEFNKYWDKTYNL